MATSKQKKQPKYNTTKKFRTLSRSKNLNYNVNSCLCSNLSYHCGSAELSSVKKASDVMASILDKLPDGVSYFIYQCPVKGYTKQLNILRSLGFKQIDRGYNEYLANHFYTYSLALTKDDVKFAHGD